MSRPSLRIALITAVYPPFLGGISVAVHQRARWLLEQGHTVFLLHPAVNDKYPDKILSSCSLPGLEELISFPNFSSYAYPTQPLLFYKMLPEPLNYRHWSDTHLLGDFQPDIVVVEEGPMMRGFYSLFLGGYGRPVGSEYARLTNIPVILLFHTDTLAYISYYFGNWAYKLFRPVIAALVKRFSQAYDVNYFSSREQLEKYQEIQAQNCQYLAYQGVNCQKFHPENIRYNPIPGDSRPTVLFVGRIAREKNIDYLLNAFPLIAQRIPDTHLVIVGSGPQEEEISKRATQLGKGVTFWGPSYGTELLGWFARADVFVNPSMTENFCTTTNEALASGTPVVAVKAPSTAEQILPSINGFLAEPDNLEDFADKVIQILEDSTLKAKMSEQSRASILKFDWSACMERFEGQIYQLVEKSSRELHKV